MSLDSPETTLVQAQSIDDVQAAVRDHSRIVVRSGGSKPALSTPDGEATLLELSELAGVQAYEPSEFTFTALAGTPLQTVQTMLAEKGQYLPFDPPLAQAGATLGGVVAAGTAGCGRVRYGGVRDFLIGIRFVDGQANLVHGGGKVVKNAAGFDFPKLMVGSLGRLGVLVEVTFKVFPRPAAFASLRLDLPRLDPALDALYRLTASSLELHGLDLVPHGEGVTLWVRMGGLAATLPDRMEQLRRTLGGGEMLAEIQEPGHWQEMATMSWRPQETALVKVPVTPIHIPALDSTLAEAPRRYSVAGNLAWIAWPGPLTDLDTLLKAHKLSGLVLMGPTGQPWLGLQTGAAFARRVKQALDPAGKFPALP